MSLTNDVGAAPCAIASQHGSTLSSYWVCSPSRVVGALILSSDFEGVATNGLHSVGSGGEAQLRYVASIMTVLSLALAGCSSVADAPLIGVPANAPARPQTPGAYLPVHDMPPARQNDTMSVADQTPSRRSCRKPATGARPRPPQTQRRSLPPTRRRHPPSRPGSGHRQRNPASRISLGGASKNQRLAAICWPSTAGVLKGAPNCRSAESRSESVGGDRRRTRAGDDPDRRVSSRDRAPGNTLAIRPD